MGEFLAIASAAMSIAGGLKGKQASDVQAEQYREEQDNARIAALQEEGARRRELKSILATGEAVRAGRGLELDSGTARAIRGANIAEAERDIESIRLNGLNKVRRYGLAADQASAEGTGRLFAGFGSAAGTLSKAGLFDGPVMTGRSKGELPPGGL